MNRWRAGAAGVVIGLASALLLATGAVADDSGDVPTEPRATLRGEGYTYNIGAGDKWEGTYAIVPAGATERETVWCSQSGFRLPEDGQPYGPEVPLTYRSGAPYPAAAMAELAAKITFAQQTILADPSDLQTVYDYSAAMALIIHRDTTDDAPPFNAPAILAYFGTQTPVNGGNVPGIVAQLDAIGTAYPGPWTVSATLTAAPDAKVGDPATLAVTVTSASGTAVPGRIIDLTSVTGLSGLPATITTGPAGEAATATATTTSTRASLIAGLRGPSADVNMRVPTPPYLPSPGGSTSQPQNMVFLGTGTDLAADPALQVNGTVSVLKIDAETRQPLAGAVIRVVDSTGATVATFTSGTTATVLALPEGDYTAVEVSAPSGYTTDATPVPFSIAPDSTFPVPLVMTNAKGIADTGLDPWPIASLAGLLLIAGAAAVSLRRVRARSARD